MLRKGVLVVSMYSYDTLLVDFSWSWGLLIWTKDHYRGHAAP
jgi:hypothetical protein